MQFDVGAMCFQVNAGVAFASAGIGWVLAGKMGLGQAN